MQESANSPTIIIHDALRRAVEKETDESVTVLYDEKGYPSYMLVVPRFDVSTIDSSLGTGTHPAFIVDGKEKEQIFVGQFPATVQDGFACSLPDAEPQTYINFDDSRSACARKGKGWHLITAWEWAAVAFWITKNRSKHFKRTCWEWNDGLKLLDGRILFPNDNAITMPEADWPFQGACFDADGDDPVLSAEVSHFSEEDPRGADDDRDDDYAYIGDLKDLGASDSYKALPVEARERLARIMIDPAPRSILSDMSGGLYVRNYGERLPFRGGSWYGGAIAGLAGLDLNDRRSNVYNGLGLRPAFIL